jgi:hypothetical protein
MNYLLRLAASLIAVGLLVFGACALRQDVVEELGLDVWHWPEWQQALEAEEQREEGLDQLLEGVTRRREERFRIGRELIAGQITLADAVRQTWALGGSTKNLRWHLTRYGTGLTDDQRMALHVVDWTCEILDEQPDQEEAFRVRMLAQLKSWPSETRLSE